MKIIKQKNKFNSLPLAQIKQKTMIHVLINTLAEKMNEFLSSYYERAEIIVEAGSIDATPNEDQSDKIILSIVNIERETAMGISAPI